MSTQPPPSPPPPPPLPLNTEGLTTLQKEPEKLRQEAHKLQATLESLYRDHYEVFIVNHECMSFIQERGRGFHTDLASLQAEIDGLKTDAHRFEKGAHEIVLDLKRNRQTLQHHLQLVELLEVPQLMDACIRNNLYEEAVDIVAFANTLERRHLLLVGPGGSGGGSGGGGTSPQRRASLLSRSLNRSVSTAADKQTGAGATTTKSHTFVIAGLVQDLRALQGQLRERLLYQLRLPLQLPRCLQIISCLRKLDALALEAAHIGLATKAGDDEHEAVEHRLQVDFLEARDAWLQTLIMEGNNTHTHTHTHTSGGGGSGSSLSHSRTGSAMEGPEAAAAALMRVIETNRTHWFEIATQFRAIFLDDEVTHTQTQTQTSATSNKNKSTGGGSKTLSAWLLRRITAFLSQLEGGLGQVTDGAALVDVMEQCLFFAASMGRIGVDFRELLVPVFARAIRGMAEVHWNGAHAELAGLLERCAREGVAVAAATAAAASSSSGGSQQHQRGGSGGQTHYHMCYVLPGGVAQHHNQPPPPPPPQPQEPKDGGEETDETEQSAQQQGGGQEKEEEVLLIPPPSILTYPPLAQFTNLILTSFNQLRQCTPWALVNELQTLFLTHIHAAIKTILTHQSQFLSSAACPPLLKQQYRQLKEEARVVVMPYLLRCFAAMVAGAKGGGGGGGGSVSLAVVKAKKALKQQQEELEKVWNASSSEMLMAAE